MAAPTILQVMDGLEVRLASITGLRTAAHVLDAVNPPTAVVGVPEIPDYRITFRRGLFQLAPTVTLLVSGAFDRIGQRMLAEYAQVSGTTSIPAAIEGDRTLGGIVDECVVDSFRPLGLEEVGVIGYYGGVFTLRVIAQGA